MPDRKSEKDDLKAREYRDENGQVHHHTHKYMEAHGKSDGGGGRASAGRDRSDGRREGAGREGRSGDDRRAESEGRTSRSARTTTDHDEIRTWAEDHGGRPAAVKRTHKGGDVGIIRIMFPDAPNSEHDALTEISWDEFFDEFDQRDLALLYSEDSMFSKIIGRDTAEKRAEGDNDAAR